MFVYTNPACICSNGHTFNYCSKTFLVINHLNTVKCITCDSVSMVPDNHLDDDTILDTSTESNVKTGQSPIVTKVLENFEKCVYCQNLMF
ncbi:hypothetical protein AYI68_g5113 [Smittium mucronatum]|uniref:Transcription factor IIIC putative zinc-finger domain-containing protein n=1 Tax=Smittium mucronatum TaxID=133383 RepID=A0A1R0GV50_9FUNG|nr:hypothetical protein AYI68_g5113 [Smittium mucronatum]